MKAYINAAINAGVKAGVPLGANLNPELIGGIWNDTLLWADNNIWKD